MFTALPSIYTVWGYVQPFPHPNSVGDDKIPTLRPSRNLCNPKLFCCRTIQRLSAGAGWRRSRSWGGRPSRLLSPTSWTHSPSTSRPRPTKIRAVSPLPPGRPWISGPRSKSRPARWPKRRRRRGRRRVGVTDAARRRNGVKQITPKRNESTRPSFQKTIALLPATRRSQSRPRCAPSSREVELGAVEGARLLANGGSTGGSHHGCGNMIVRVSHPS